MKLKKNLLTWAIIKILFSYRAEIYFFYSETYFIRVDAMVQIAHGKVSKRCANFQLS
jgi:hypothetical protein